MTLKLCKKLLAFDAAIENRVDSWVRRIVYEKPPEFYEAIGWVHAECCAALDRGEDPRDFEVSELVEKCVKDLSKPGAKRVIPE